MGATDDALKTAGELKELVASGINSKELRYPEFILGLIELRKGDAPRAVELFESACARLDSEDFWGNDQGLFLDGYAEALRLAGNLNRARETYERITLLTTGRREDGDIYGRAFYRLGKIAEQRGEDEAAQAYFRKFLSLWVGADPGLPEVLDAAVRLSRR
jgi:tetratricopeptide (TPR) repeat protein